MTLSGDDKASQGKGFRNWLGEIGERLSIGSTTMQVPDLHESVAEPVDTAKPSAPLPNNPQEKRPKTTAIEPGPRPSRDGSHDKSDTPPEEVDPVLDNLIQQVSHLSVSSMSTLLDAVYAQSPNHTNPSPPTSDLDWTKVSPSGKRPSSRSTFIELHKRFKCDVDLHYKEKIQRLRDDRRTLNSRLAAAHQQLEHERNHTEQQIAILQTKVAELSHVHVRSVNGIGAGLDPISDQTFTEVLAEHHVKTFQWCRKNLRGKKLLDHDHLPEEQKGFIADQCSGWPTGLSVARAADLIFWLGLENMVFHHWFPVEIAEGKDCGLGHVEWLFTRDDLPEHPQRIEFWRGYTACLAFQSAAFPPAVDEAVDSFVAMIVPYALGLFAEQHEVDRETLREIVHAIFITAAQLRCQRGLYEVEQLQPGVEFDEDLMDDLDNKEFGSEVKMVVKVVLSNGIVKRPYRGSEEVIGRVCKPRVLICQAE